MNMKQSCKALICAIEGELDGRHCTEEQAAAILDHALPSLTEALARMEAERDAALANAPTQWAYDQACRTLHKHRELANTAQALLREVDAYLSGHGDNAICNGSRLHRDIKDLLAGQIAVSGTTSDQYRAELYDEVWEKARDMGYGNVTDALVALKRMKADHEANGLEYGEALILIGQVLDCRSLEDLNAVRRYLNEFMDRYSLRPVPDVDLVQAEQQEAQGPMAKMAEGLRQKAADEWASHPSNPVNQEAQGAQAGDERAAFEKWAKDRSWFDPRPSTKERDDSLFCYEEAITDHNWIAWQARAALATQPAAGAPAAWQWRRRIKGGAWDAWENGRYDFEPAPFMDVEHRALYAAPPAAAHGDDVVAVVGTVPDGSGFKSLDFKVELQDLPDGTRLYAHAGGAASR